MKVVAGNWKMHHGPAATRSFFTRLRVPDEPAVDVLVFPPSVSLAAAASAVDGWRQVGLGVQNIHWERSGAYTGEISAAMAVEAGAAFALIGHSERRHVFGETDEEVARKVTAARAAGLVPVVCVGETLDERRAGRVEEVILRQLDHALEADGVADGRLLIAYEPVWAIGTGETATPGDASAAHATLAARIHERLGARSESAVPILYGGSVKPDNAAELLAAPHVGGVLVGGASLDPESFSAIVARAAECTR